MYLLPYFPMYTRMSPQWGCLWRQWDLPWRWVIFSLLVKFIYSEKARKFCKIFPLLLTVCTVVKIKGKISQNFVAFSEYMNFNKVKNWLRPYCIICILCRLCALLMSVIGPMNFCKNLKETCATKINCNRVIAITKLQELSFS